MGAEVGAGVGLGEIFDRAEKEGKEENEGGTEDTGVEILGVAIVGVAGIVEAAGIGEMGEVIEGAVGETAVFSFGKAAFCIGIAALNASFRSSSLHPPPESRAL